MSTPLLSTTLYLPPTCLKPIAHPRLISKLNTDTYPGSKLVMISAIAGFSKSTLPSEWIQAMSRITRSEAIAQCWIR